jgi:hypothetical protein
LEETEEKGYSERGLVLITSRISKENLLRKHKAEVSWRYVIAKGLQHIEECQPKAQIMAESYNSVIKARNYAKFIHWLQQKYPRIWDEMIMETEWKV